MPIVRPLFVAAVFSLLATSARAEEIRPAWQETVTIIHDGKLTPEEWDGAAMLEFGPAFTTHWKQTKDDLFIGIRFKLAYAPFVDLYISPDEKRTYNLHASMQLGERELTHVEQWTDRTPPTHWGVTHRWMANAISVDKSAPRDASFKRRAVPYEGFEFRIGKSKFAGETWRLRIELRDMEKSAIPMAIPFGSKRYTPTTWLEVDMTPPGASGSTSDSKPASSDAKPAPSTAPVSGDAKPAETKPSDPKNEKPADENGGAKKP